MSRAGRLKKYKKNIELFNFIDSIADELTSVENFWFGAIFVIFFFGIPFGNNFSGRCNKIWIGALHRINIFSIR